MFLALQECGIAIFQKNIYYISQFKMVFCSSGEGAFHILHYVQYGLDGVEKFHLRAAHKYRSVA